MVIENFKKYSVVLFLCLFGYGVYAGFFLNVATVNLSIQVEKRTVFQMYWAEANEGFSEKKSVKLVVAPKQKQYQFLLTNVRNVKKIRLDPQKYAGESIIEELIIQQEGIKPIHYNFKNGFYTFKERNHISEYHLEEKGLVIRSNGRDPFLAGDIIIEKAAFPWLVEFFRFGFICLFIVLIYSSTKHLNAALGYIPILSVIALTLIIIMAMISQRNVHPDEHVHIEASRYYQNNWLPPSIDDPGIRHTYSVYGSSRLNKPEIFYLFSGKFAELTSFLRLRPFWLFRLFNVFLFTCILLYTIKSTGARSMAMPLLISPQIWYVFSYTNSDAFSLFIAFLVGIQIVVPGSMFNTFLKQKPDNRLLIRALLLGFLLGCLLLLKQNFYLYIAFVITVIIGQIWEMESGEEQILAVKRVLILTLIGLSLFGLRRGADYYVNGLDKAEKLIEISIETAHPLYNPQTELNKKHPYLSMKKRGVSLKSIVDRERFFEKTFRSSFGVYGNFTVSATFKYYDIVRWTAGALLLVFLGLIFLYSWRKNGFIAIIGLFFSLLLIAISFYHSWTKDFQAQGRYLFPIVSMLGIVSARGHRYLKGPLFTSLFFGMFLLSAYSFIFIAIPQIPKALFN